MDKIPSSAETMEQL